MVTYYILNYTTNNSSSKMKLRKQICQKVPSFRLITIKKQNKSRDTMKHTRQIAGK